MSNDFGGKKRSELPDNVFGIPQERKYPMPDEKHTRSAIKLFNHVEPKYEEQLAKAIIKNMKKYNIDGSVVGPNNRLRKYLPKDMIKESMLLEGLLKSDKDIYYNKDKFDSGEINLCFITGLSGSGKSTMGRGMSSKDVEHYEMDDIICNYAFSDDNLKEYGGLVESFFKGPGKEYRLKRGDEDHNNAVFDSHENYEKEITHLFVKHAISYCKSHKRIKYICDGIWIFMFIKPEQLKDCAVYIKGTSSIKSGYRALKRDIDEDKRNGMTSLQIFKHEFKRVKEDILYARENQKELKSFRSYFEKQLTNESVSSTVSKDHKQKGYISLSSLKKVHITESVINKYKKEYPVLRHVRCKDTDEYVCDGYMWFKDDSLVCYVGSCQYTDDNTKWIVSLEILPEYRGYGLSNQILDFCVKSMNCKYLSVNKNNQLAKKIYDKYGFKVYHEDKSMYYMTLDSIVKESSKYQIKQGEIDDMKTVISSLNDDSFKGFRFTNISYYDIRYRSKKPIAFITIRTKPVNNCTVGYVSLAVDPKYQNQGIGKSLTEKAIQWFKGERGIDFLEWWCLPDNEASNKLANAAGFKEYIARDQSEYIHYTMESSISEYGTTAGTMVGSNQPDSVYIVNYMQNNAFSGHKESKFGICKKGMKDLHVVGGKYNRFHYVNDIDKFKEEASDIHVYRYKGKPKNEFYDIIEDMNDNDLNIYKMITGREIEDRSMIQFDGDFIEEDCFFDEIDAIKAVTEAGISEVVEDLHAIPILTEMVQGRSYNYYRDINGVFAQNEITNIRSKSYESIDEIPKTELDIVKRGYLV